jgi:hypothetical protein
LLAEVYPAGEAPLVAADGRSLARALRVAGKVEPVFVEQIGDHLSISDLRDLIDHLADELAKQEAARHKRVSEI